MNEELKIIIKAVTSDAKKKIDEVKKKLDDTKKSGEKGGKGIAEAMAAIKKGAAIAVSAIVAVTTALIAFGKSTLEAQKEISKLNAAFLSAGSSAEQAKTTYTELFRFMGDSGAATEAAQQLALITTNSKDLAEWTKILQGVYATMGSTLPIESLAEAANETIKVGKVTGTFADAVNWLGVSEDALNDKLATMASETEREAYLRALLNDLYSNAANTYERNNQALLQHNESQANLTIALAKAGSAVMPLLTAFNNLSATLLNTLKPALAVIAQMIAIVVGWISTAIGWISAFFSLFSGKGKEAADTTKTIANNTASIGGGFKNATSGASGLNKGLKEASKAAKELKKQTMGFDELNVVSSNTESSGGSGSAGGGGGAGVAVPSIADLGLENPLENVKEDIENVRAKAEAILTLAGLIGGALLAWKIASILSEVENLGSLLAGLKTKLLTFSGIILAIAGAVMLVQGYCDAWVNGIDWGNFALIIGGVALLVTGIYLAFGTMAAACVAVGAGLAMVVLAIKDLITNGFSWEALLMLVIGVVVTLTAAVLAFNAALLANPITWVVIAIAALVAAIAVCIIYWDDVKVYAVNAWNKIKEIWEKVANWFDEKVIKPMANFFKDLWAKITEAFGKTKEWFSEKFSGAWAGIKVVWDLAVNYFQLIWNNIKAIFSVVKSVLTGNFSEAWEGIKQIFSNFGTYFSNLWNIIKNTFTALGTKIGDAVGGAVKSGINSVIDWIEKTINKAINLINGAIDLINKLPGVSVGKLDKLTLPRLATGGIVGSATVAMIGEAGKEAVLPLENNTEWMDILAARINGASNTPVIFQVDGKTFAEISVNSINQLTKQKGSLQLALV